MDRKLLCEIVQRIECVAGIEAFLVLTVAALHLTVVPRGIRANQLMPDAQLSSRPLKQRRQLALPAGEAVGKLGTVVRLDTLHLIASANENFLLTPGAKSDTLNALQAMMGVAARSCGRKCPPVGTVTAVECGSFPNSGGTTDYDLVRPELRRQFRAFFY